MNKPRTQPEHPAVRQANRTSDYVLFWCIIFVCLCLLLVPIFFSTWFLGELRLVEVGEQSVGLLFLQGVLEYIDVVALLAAALVFLLVSIRMMRQVYLANALQVEYSAHAWLREWANTIARDLDMPRVEVMITQDPVMNAFAFGFARPYTIVLNSGTIRWTTKAQLQAIVLHEMAHIKYKHTQLSTYASLLRFIPLIGTFFGWLLDFWQRRCEFTADRLALAYLQNKQQVRDALVSIHIGPDAAPAFNDVAQQWQAYNTENTFNRLTQTFSSHPFLVRRLQQLDALEPVLAPPKTPGVGNAPTA